MVSLDEYAEVAEDKSTRDFVCKLPVGVRQQIHDARNKSTPTPYPVIVDWLISEGYEGANIGKLRDHFYKNHAVGDGGDD